jgi:hypothetical protein
LSDEYGLLVAFPDESETFVLGFEAGQIWADLEVFAMDDRTVHVKNQEVIRRMARARGYSVEFTPHDVDWCVAKFSRGQRPQLRAV